jgi:hypothetical protein
MNGNITTAAELVAEFKVENVLDLQEGGVYEGWTDDDITTYIVGLSTGFFNYEHPVTG